MRHGENLVGSIYSRGKLSFAYYDTSYTSGCETSIICRSIPVDRHVDHIKLPRSAVFGMRLPPKQGLRLANESDAVHKSDTGLADRQWTGYPS